MKKTLLATMWKFIILTQRSLTSFLKSYLSHFVLDCHNFELNKPAQRTSWDIRMFSVYRISQLMLCLWGHLDDSTPPHMYTQLCILELKQLVLSIDGKWIDRYFDNLELHNSQFLKSKMAYILWLQRLKFAFLVFYDSKLNIFQVLHCWADKTRNLNVTLK